ncbi:class I SAM-dependent methyltransferase [Pectobacterium versatile]|uniref:class I SAM-dependent methyltransferase n=2 Tax=Pectobacterium TaxID=122277 RepID=UPI001BB2ECC9
MPPQRPILDMCSGSRMFWFDKSDSRAVFSDIRRERHVLCDGRSLEINPDVIADFRALPFDDEQFALVVFDPPHLLRAGESSWLRKKYGALDRDTWQEDLRAGFSEAFRVLRPLGTLIFKWNETQIPVRDVLALTDQRPAFGHLSGKRSNTHWICFLKGETHDKQTD